MAFNLAPYLAQNTGGIGLLGALIGGSAAAAKNISDARNGRITRDQAIRRTGEEAAGAGVATAVGAAATTIVGGGLLISLGTAAVVATAAKYAWDQGVRRTTPTSER